MYGARKLGVFLISLAVIAFSHSSVLGKSAAIKDLQNSQTEHGKEDKYPEIAVEEKEQDDDGEVSLEELTEDELEEYVDAEDGKLFSELDIIGGKAALKVQKGRSKRYVVPGARAIVSVGKAVALTLSKDKIKDKVLLALKKGRSKRWVGGAAKALFSAGRALARTLSKGRTTSSAGKITRQYHKAGDYQTAVRDFNSLSPSNPKPFTGKNGLEGITGQLGSKYTIQARSGSSSGSPTLEIFQNGKPNGSIVRKMRYE